MSVFSPADPPTRWTPLKPILRPEDRRGQRRYWVAMLLGVVLIASYLFVINGVIVRTSYDIWAAFVLAPLLFLVSVPFLQRMLNLVEPDRWIHRVVIGGLAAKLIGGFARYLANEHVFGRGDAEEYHIAGTALAAELRHFMFGGPAFQQYLPELTGTEFIRLLTSIVYVITGSSILGGFIVFSFISYWGLYFFYRAYCIAMPDGLRRRYAVLVFFLPSVVFWPSSIGKEAWMTTMLGLGSYGLARLLAYKRFGYLGIFAAMAGMGMVRPHVTAVFGASLGAAFVLRRSKPGGGGTARKILGLIVLAAVAGLLINQLQSFFDLDSGLDAQQVFDETIRRSSQGGSQFETVQPTSLTELPWAFVTVLFRPFLFEAFNPGSMVTSLEGTVLLAMFVWNASRLIRLPSLMLSRPYVGYAVIYTLTFVFAFSAISNFGILARQRTQLYPIAVIVLTVPFQSTLKTRRDLEVRKAGGREPPPPEPDEQDVGRDEPAAAAPADRIWQRGSGGNSRHGPSFLPGPGKPSPP